MAWPRPTATTRLAWGLVSLTISLILLLDLALGLFPTEDARLRQLREREAQALAIQARVLLLQPDGAAFLSRAMDDLAAASEDIASVGVRREDGTLVSASAGHEQAWVVREDLRSTMSAVTVPLKSPQGLWGRVEIRYRDQGALAGWRNWLGGGVADLDSGFGQLWRPVVLPLPEAHASASGPVAGHS